MRFVWCHLANKKARLRALIRAIRFQASGRFLHRRTRARLGERSSIWADVHRTGASKVIYANPPDYPEMLVRGQVLGPGDLFLNLGANAGSYSIGAAELGADVISLEPADDTFALLSENIALNGYPIVSIKAAAGSRCGKTHFASGRDPVNRIHADGDVEATMVTIDSVVMGLIVAGMQIDVEGFKVEVLNNCERPLAEQRIKLIQLECNMTSQSSVVGRWPSSSQGMDICSLQT